MQIRRFSIEDVTCILQGITFTIRYLEFGCNTFYEHLKKQVRVYFVQPKFLLCSYLLVMIYFFILEALLKPDSSCKFQLILYCFQFGKILYPGQCILGP